MFDQATIAQLARLPDGYEIRETLKRLRRGQAAIVDAYHVKALEVQGWEIQPLNADWKRKWNVWSTMITLGEPDDELADWAGDVLDDIDDAVAIVLDKLGFKIVNTIDGNLRWPFGAQNTGLRCPEWCENLR